VLSQNLRKKRKAMTSKSYLVKELVYIPKEELTEEDKAKLTVQRVNFFGTNKGSYTLMRFKYGRVGVPRYYINQTKYPPVKGKWETIHIPFIGKLRPYQQKVIDMYMRNLKRFPYGGIIQMPTGTGKTVVGIALACLLGYKTMIVVHTEVIRNQWLEAIRKFTGQEPGLIQQSVRDYRPITVAMIQTLLNASIPPETFGHIIYDEVHIMGAEKFSETAPKFNPKIRTGLSATPTRADGKTYIFKWHIGPILASYKAERKDFKVIKIEYADPKTSGRGCYRGNKFIRSKYNEKLDVPRRNRLIAKLADTAVKRRNKVLILSDSLALLDQYARLVETKNIAWLTGSKKTYTGKEDIIFGTYQAAGIGFDAPEINCVIFATPRSNVTQAIGRLSRYTGNKPVMVFDVVDVLCKQANNYWKRKKRDAYSRFQIIEKSR